MKGCLFIAALVGAFLAIAGFIVAASGLVPLKASSGHWAVTQWILRFGMKRSVATHSLTIRVPDNLGDPHLVLKGAGHYDIGCRACHGEPGRPPPRIPSRMLPPPPELTSRIRESNPRKLFYIVKHGMKFTGMPAWPSAQRDDEVWAVVAFLMKYPDLDTSTYRELVGGKRDDGAPLAEAAPVVQAPRAVLASCVRCHGNDGLGRNSPAFPVLAGQRSEYLRNALEAYATGRRHSGIMEPVAGALTAETIAEIAGYYSGIRDRGAATAGTRSAMETDSAAIARGLIIAQQGIPAQRVPACVECHGPGGRKRKPEYPLLAGQFAEYLELQLTLFKEERRGGSAYAHLMKPVASRLTPEQVRDVTQYFSSLPGPGASRAAGSSESRIP